uniref:D-alanyl-D-alanine carboxypeptidase n=1 Tax=uncultured Nocardioidaceae bacterium TaxID=253824 RepID=A0A6J4L4P0_9ACTN|nr:MAG: D-alanyl-D-alanine carboxypeptidase [uncultured Nocardioidaceae bacterium]
MPEGDPPHSPSWPRRTWVLLLVVALLAGTGGVLWERGVLDELFAEDEQPVSALDAPAPAGLELPAARTSQEVLDEPSGAAVSAADVRARLLPLMRERRFGARIGVAVHDLTHDRPVLEVGGGSYMPASTVKLLTAAAALELLGPAHRFETTVIAKGRLGGAGSRRPPRLTLVGGGDPMLASKALPGDYPQPATLRSLVTRTAAALQEAGVRRVRVGYDDSLFKGPAVSPAWEPDYVPGVTSPVSALSVDEGVDPDTFVRSTDPAALAAGLFADGLRARGIRVATVPDTSPAAGGREIASVQSPPLERVVGHVLRLSDNEGAEMLLRHVGIAAGTGASFTGGAAGARTALRPLGVSWAGVRLLDGSGLARGNRLPLHALVALLRLGADDDRADLRAVLGGLPVAGFDGTLANRYLAEATSDALGLVRAKTGTLTGTHALAGTVVDADGVLLGFVAVANGVKERNTLFARDQLDRITAALAGCGCRR